MSRSESTQVAESTHTRENWLPRPPDHSGQLSSSPGAQSLSWKDSGWRGDAMTTEDESTPRQPLLLGVDRSFGASHDSGRGAPSGEPAAPHEILSPRPSHVRRMVNSRHFCSRSISAFCSLNPHSQRSGRQRIQVCAGFVPRSGTKRLQRKHLSETWQTSSSRASLQCAWNSRRFRGARQVLDAAYGDRSGTRARPGASDGFEKPEAGRARHGSLE
jgi:hypothetical protein